MDIISGDCNYRDIGEKYGELNHLSHVLHTPLTCILGFTRLLNLEKLNAKQKKYTGHIDVSAHQLLLAIDYLLDEMKQWKQKKRK